MFDFIRQDAMPAEELIFDTGCAKAAIDFIAAPYMGSNRRYLTKSVRYFLLETATI